MVNITLVLQQHTFIDKNLNFIILFSCPYFCHLLNSKQKKKIIALPSPLALMNTEQPQYIAPIKTDKIRQKKNNK